MNMFVVFEFSNKFASRRCFYCLCTLKIKKVIALASGPGFFGPPCRNIPNFDAQLQDTQAEGNQTNMYFQ